MIKWNSFFAGFIVAILLVIIVEACFSDFNRESEPFIPTATTTEFEGQEYVIFYDAKGNICEIVPNNTNIEYD